MDCNFQLAAGYNSVFVEILDDSISTENSKPFPFARTHGKCNLEAPASNLSQGAVDSHPLATRTPLTLYPLACNPSPSASSLYPLHFPPPPLIDERVSWESEAFPILIASNSHLSANCPHGPAHFSSSGRRSCSLGCFPIKFSWKTE